jgi:biotin transporter BioY
MNIRPTLIGDYIRPKLKAQNIPVEGYIIVETLILMTLAAKLNFNLPFSDLPFTLQSLVAICSGAIYGHRSAVLAVSVYLLIGLLGLPVFSAETAGIEYFSGNRIGFLMGFVLAAFAGGYTAKMGWGKKISDGLMLMFIGHTALIFMGLFGIYVFNSNASLFETFISILPGALLKSALGAWMLRFFWNWLETHS